MLSPAFEWNFSAYLAIASLTIFLWDILDNIRSDYRMLFRHYLGLPTILYFLSRVSVLGWVLLTTIQLTAPFISCTAVIVAGSSFYFIGVASTQFLAYLRVCAVWHRKRFIVVFFGVSWLSVIATGFTLIKSIKEAEEGSYCTDIIANRGKLLLVSVIMNFFNHTAIFLAITYGVCKNTMGKDLNFRDCIRLMIGEGLPTFSKALLHDSQVSYMIIMVLGATALVWYYIWSELQPTSAFRLALSPPFIVLENIMICRVFRNTKFGLYNKAPLQSNNPNSKTHSGANDMMSCSFGHNSNDTHSTTITPIQIAVSQDVDYKSDYSPSPRSKHSGDFLDFGEV